MVKVMKLPPMKDGKRKKKPPVKYRKKEYNYWSMMINWIKNGYASVADWIDLTTNFNPDGSCTDRMHWLQKLDYKTHCKVCGKALHDEKED